MYFCTLFDSNYLDKGITLIHSLEEQIDEFHLYVLPMDVTCSSILRQLNYKSVTVIDYNDFLTDELKVAKGNRSAGEFCWTCTPFVINYCLRKYGLDFVTYIDSDLYFFENPKVLVDEMIDKNAEVQIIRHNFMAKEYKDYVKASGEFCVQFNTFLNTDKAFIVLNEWMKDCINDCSYNVKDNVLGDQMYLNSWPQKYDCVNISNHLGAGVAPWNIRRFSYSLNEKGKYFIYDSETNKKWPIIFFHFQNLLQVSDNRFYCCYVKRSQKNKVKKIIPAASILLNFIFRFKEYYYFP